MPIPGPQEPTVKRAYVFFDGMNLFNAAKEAFGYTYPNYDVRQLAERVCQLNGWELVRACFYTGVHRASVNPELHAFWTSKVAQLGRDGVYTFTRELRYSNRVFTVPGGIQQSVLVPREKGIDVRIAIEITSLAHKRAYDVAVIFSQDQDLSEVATEVREIAAGQTRWVKLASAFPVGPTTRNPRGINGTDWIKVDKATYDACIDTRDYRPKAPPNPSP